MTLCKSLLTWGFAPAISAISILGGVHAARSQAQDTLTFLPLPGIAPGSHSAAVNEAPRLPTFVLPALETPAPRDAQPYDEPELRHLQLQPLQPLPRVVVPAEATSASVTRLSIQPWTRADAATETATPLSVSHPVSHPESAPQEIPITVRPLVPAPLPIANPQIAGGPVLDTSSMTSKPLNGPEIFSGLRSQLPNLQTEKRFFESATLAEPLRTQMFDEGLAFWEPAGYCWQSPAFCHSPLYFEQANYERYGQGKDRPWAPALSAAHFVSHVTTLPISLFCTPPWTQSCTLGHHRPGNCAPIQRKSEHR